MSRLDRDRIRRKAMKLARDNMQAEPSIREVYWFPADDEVRLIELDPTTVPSDEIAPFYFRADSRDRMGCVIAIAIIRPREKSRLSPPEGWGSWKDARKITPPPVKA